MKVEIDTPGGALAVYARELKKNWQAWAKETDEGRKERLRENVEYHFAMLSYHFAMLSADLNDLLKVWRSAFQKAPDTVMFFDELR